MNSNAIEVRSVENREELEGVYDILDKVFPNGKHFFQQRLDYDQTYSFSTTWIAKCDGQLASTVQIFPFHCRIEDVEIKVGGLGSVATLPEYRGRRLCQKILNRQTEWMSEQGFDLSLLFAVITPFYEKLGWNVVPEPVYAIKSALVPPVQLQTEYEIISFHSDYIEAMSDMYAAFNRNRSYSVARPESFWRDQLQWPRWETSACLIALKNGRPAAYGQISKTMEGRAHIEELIYLAGDEKAAVPLFQSLMQLRPDAVDIHAKLPSDHVLINALTEWGAQQQLIQYAMWKVIGLYPLLKKMTGVFTRRLQQSGEYGNKNCCLRITCGSQHAYLNIASGTVSVELHAQSHIAYNELELSQEKFITYLFQGADEASSMTSHSKLLQALFPKQPFVFYVTDKF